MNILREKSNLDNLYHTLKDCYLNQGYMVKYNDVKGQLELYLSDESKVSLIIKLQNCYGLVSSVSDLLKQLEEDNDCYNFKIVYLDGVDSSCNIFNKLNVSVTDFTYISELIEQTRRGIQYIELLPHNLNAYNEMVSYLSKTNKVAIEHATGTGKSSIVTKLISTLNYSSILYVAPTNLLLKQMSDALSIFNLNITYKTYSQLSYDFKNDVLSDHCYDLIILDEYHRGGAVEWVESVRYILSKNNAVHKIGLTATPIRYLDNNRNMTSELFDGCVASTLTLVDALAKRLLPTPKYISCVYNGDCIPAKLYDELSNTNYSMEYRKAISAKIDKLSSLLINDTQVKKLLKKHINFNNGKYIAFCKDKYHMLYVIELFKKWFKDIGINNVEYLSVHSEYGREHNLRVLNKFQNMESRCLKILFSIDMLNEGIDIKGGLDGVFLMRETISGIIYYQQLGRAIRVTNNSQPIVFDFVSNFSALGYKSLGQTLNESLAEINNLRKALNLDTVDISFDISDSKDDIIAMFQDIHVAINDVWDSQYSNLVDFKNQYGHCRVPIKDPKYKTLGNWVSRQRELFKKGNLSEAKIEKLKEIDFIFSVYESMWYDRYYEYVDCLKKGTSRSEGLIQWCSSVRNDFIDKKLSAEKIELLNKVNFNFKKKISNREYSFEELAELFMDYIKSNNAKYVKSTTTHKGVNIGAWFTNLKYTIKIGKISCDRIEYLEKLGIVNVDSNNELSLNFVGKNSVSWEECFERFLSLYGNDDISDKDKKWLSRWKSKQKTAILRNTLSQDKVQKISKYIKINCADIKVS